jgi:hypothetical protein
MYRAILGALMRCRWFRYVSLSLCVVSEIVGQPLPQVCADPAHALVFLPRDVPPEVERSMQLELSVEAQRLGFESCRSTEGVPAVTVQVNWASTLAQLEVTVGKRVLSREVPFENDTDGKVLELALILGDLVREAVAPLVTPNLEPEIIHWRMGARGGIDVFPSTLGVLYSCALVLREQGPRFGFETALGGNASRVVEVAVGSVSLAGIFVEFAGLLRTVSFGPFQFYLSGGFQFSAISISANATQTAQEKPGWAATGDARLGGVLETRVGRSELAVRFGAALPVRGLMVLADGQPLIGIGGLGFYTSFGISFGRLDHL